MAWWQWLLVSSLAPLFAAGLIWCFRLLAAAIGRHVLAELAKQLDLDEMRANLSPGVRGWPNGSTTLPESIVEIYRRVNETQRAVEALHTDGL